MIKTPYGVLGKRRQSLKGAYIEVSPGGEETLGGGANYKRIHALRARRKYFEVKFAPPPTPSESERWAYA